MASLSGRLLWHVNRSPLAHVVKAAVTAANLGEKKQRRSLARSFGEDPVVAGRAAELRRDGFVPGDDVIDPALLAELDAEGHSRLSTARQQAVVAGGDWATNKAFWVRLLDGEIKEGFRTDSIWVRFALQPRVLHLVSEALGGELPLLTYVLLTLSRHSEEPLAVSQLWHRDHDDTRVVKLFTYLTDVRDERDGPFTFLPREPSDRIGYRLRSHMPDEQVFRAGIDKSQQRVMTAERRRTFLVETSRCYHMGSRVAPGHERLMYTATYISAPTIYPRSAPPFRPIGGLDPRTTLVLGL